MKPKPRFLEVIQLGVLLGVIALAVAFVINGPEDCRQVVQSLSGDGVAGWLTTGAFLIKWIVYGTIAVMFACALCLILNALGVLTTIMEKIIGGIASMTSRVRHKVAPPPLPINTIVGHKKGGVPITLGGMLEDLQSKVKAVGQAVKELQEKTAGLQPPPPPKSPDEVIAELQAELARLRENENRKTINQPIAPAPVAEAKAV